MLLTVTDILLLLTSKAPLRSPLSQQIINLSRGNFVKNKHVRHYADKLFMSIENLDEFVA
jgi:hypothetical protein